MALSEDVEQLLGCCSITGYFYGAVPAVGDTSEQNANPAKPLTWNTPVHLSEVTPKDSPIGVTPCSAPLALAWTIWRANCLSPLLSLVAARPAGIAQPGAASVGIKPSYSLNQTHKRISEFWVLTVKAKYLNLQVYFQCFVL